MTEEKKLLAEIEAFLLKHNMPMTVLGRLASKDVHIVQRLRAGHSCTLKRAEQLRKFMKSYRPLGRRRRGKSESRSVA